MYIIARGERESVLWGKVRKKWRREVVLYTCMSKVENDIFFDEKGRRMLDKVG